MFGYTALLLGRGEIPARISNIDRKAASDATAPCPGLWLRDNTGMTQIVNVNVRKNLQRESGLVLVDIDKLKIYS
jgi:hypothetical protein